MPKLREKLLNCFARNDVLPRIGAISERENSIRTDHRQELLIPNVCRA